MVHFADKRDIKLRTTPPHHPNANPAETCMKTIGKSMKVCHHNDSSEKEARQETLGSYRQMPHPVTGIPPANMFWDCMKSQFPKRSVIHLTNLVWTVFANQKKLVPTVSFLI